MGQRDSLAVLRARVLDAVAPLAAEERGLAACEGRWLASPVCAARAAPPRAVSAMDGWAVCAAETGNGARLAPGETLFAGAATPRALAPREAARIFTGAPMPPGADAVVPQEAARELEGGVVLRAAARPGEHVRQAGEDVAAGAEALAAGVRIGPRQRALCEAVGATTVRVTRTPLVRLLTTGDEIVRGFIPDTNGVALAGLLQAAGAEVSRVSCGDDPAALDAAMAEALAGADALVTAGGVSVGARDGVPAALERVGAEILLHGVPMKPGKPFLFARAGGVPVFGLPGSPSACLVAFEVFARPALLKLAGAARTHRTALRLPAAEAIEGRPGRARLLWARIEPGGSVRPVGRDAAQVRGPALADALVLLPDGAGVSAGDLVETWLLEDGA